MHMHMRLPPGWCCTRSIFSLFALLFAPPTWWQEGPPAAQLKLNFRDVHDFGDPTRDALCELLPATKLVAHVDDGVMAARDITLSASASPQMENADIVGAGASQLPGGDANGSDRTPMIHYRGCPVVSWKGHGSVTLMFSSLRHERVSTCPRT